MENSPPGIQTIPLPGGGRCGAKVFSIVGANGDSAGRDDIEFPEDRVAGAIWSRSSAFLPRHPDAATVTDRPSARPRHHIFIILIARGPRATKTHRQASRGCQSAL